MFLIDCAVVTATRSNCILL